MSETGKRSDDHGDIQYNKEEKDIITEAPGRFPKEEEPENMGGSRNLEFVKGILFGILLSAICVMAVLLIKKGTVGLKHGSGENGGAESLTSEETWKKLEEIRDRIESSFLYEADGETLTTYLFKGLAVGLEDPYASYYTEDEVQTLTELNEGEYYGIGITVRQDALTGRFWIDSVYENSPADQAGLQKEDEILAVDGETVEEMELADLVALIRQKETVLLRLTRGEEELEINVVVTDVEIPTVSWEMLEENIGYLKITEFDRITVKQFEDAVDQMKDQGMEKLILDVRDNPGGILDAVCDIMDDLLPEGLIVYTEDKDGNREEYMSEKGQIFDGELAVLVNENSASASEIFAGSIQDYDLGPIIGTTTYGKGVVQRTYLLSDGSALKLTAEKYYTAGGQDIDGNGITPDYVVENKSSGDEETESVTDSETEDKIDLQLQCAIDYLTGKNLPEEQ